MQIDRILPSDGSRIDVGGRSLFLRHHEAGQPTVILESDAPPDVAHIMDKTAQALKTVYSSV